MTNETEQKIEQMIKERIEIANNQNLNMKVRKIADVEIQVLRKVLK